jgi:hypothetical protein
MGSSNQQTRFVLKSIQLRDQHTNIKNVPTFLTLWIHVDKENSVLQNMWIKENLNQVLKFVLLPLIRLRRAGWMS